MSHIYGPLLPGGQALSGSSVGYVKVWTGSEWEKKPLKIWTGSEWAIKPVKYRTNDAWVTTG